MNLEQIAVETLKCALSWAPDARLVGNVKASELATLAAHIIDTCPQCGATAWVNIDCTLCGICHELRLVLDRPPQAKEEEKGNGT